MTAIPPILVRDLTRAFGTKVALDSVSLSVEHGQVRALLGPNGAGKTTLIRILTGSVKPTSGEISVMGVPWNRMSHRASRTIFGLVTAGDRSSYHRLSGRENLIFFGRLYGMTRRQAAVRAEHALDIVGLTEDARLEVRHYSRGMAKRLAIARSLLIEPPVLLVDEATHDLDPAGARMVRQLLADQAAKGCAVLWATQRVDEIRDTAHRVTVLNGGAVRFDGTVDALSSVAKHTRYYLEFAKAAGLGELSGTTESGALLQVDGTAGWHIDLRDGVSLGRAVASLEEAGHQVVECRPERSQLEDAFLALTSETDN